MDDFAEFLVSQQPEGNQLNDSTDDLIAAWRTEANCPEILPFKGELVSQILSILLDQQERIDEKIEQAISDEYFTITMYQMEIERVRYSLARYLRTRLLKIEKGLDFITADIELMDRLSFEEKTFASNLKDIVNSHFDNAFVSRLVGPDDGLQKLVSRADDRQQHAKASVQDFVCCRGKRNIEDITVDDVVTSLGKGEIAYFPYKHIAGLVLDGSVELL